MSVNENVTLVISDPFSNLFPDGIFVEDFDIIPTNSALYVTAFDNGTVMELPPIYFQNHIGDLLITQDGESPDPYAALFIVHWDALNSKFVTTPIPLPPGLSRFEHVTFAPVQFPNL